MKLLILPHGIEGAQNRNEKSPLSGFRVLEMPFNKNNS
jgi:hypothetical protein